MINEQIAKIKGLIQDEVCMGTYGLVELELIELVKITEQNKVNNSVLDDVSQQRELFFAVLKWAKQADLDYPDEMLIKDFEKFTAKNCG